MGHFLYWNDGDKVPGEIATKRHTHTTRCSILDLVGTYRNDEEDDDADEVRA